MTSIDRTKKKTGMVAALLSLLIIGAASAVKAQNPDLTHNTWTTGAAMPTPRMSAAAIADGTNIYVIGGYNPGGFLGVNEIYSTKKNTWTTGAADPNPRGFAAYAVVNKILYVFGGSNGSELLDVSESYNPATNSWTTLAPMPYVQETASAVADKDVIYLIGAKTTAALSRTSLATTPLPTHGRKRHPCWSRKAG